MYSSQKIYKKIICVKTILEVYYDLELKVEKQVELDNNYEEQSIYAKKIRVYVNDQTKIKYIDVFAASELGLTTYEYARVNE